MSKKKFTRKRKTILTKKMNIKDEGIVIPEHIKKLKNPRKHFRLEDYKNRIGPLLSDLNILIKLQEIERQKGNSEFSIVQLNHLMISSHRNAVIQYFVLLDSMINELLGLRQFDLDVPNEKVEYFTEPDKGLNKFLSTNDRTPEFDSVYSRIKHFRILRNQFSHYPNGLFCLGAEKESFEDFVKKLDGIEMDSNGGFHCYINGKPGMQIPYNTTSDEYVHDLLKTGTDFFRALLEIFCPDIDNKE